MRLEKISIKNFKSIDNLDNFELIDKNITAFIGGNGCGKTNLLHAINSLKKDDELVDTNLHEKANKSDEIEISAEISFDERDLPKLKERSLDLSTIAGYKVKVNKKIGSGSTRAIEPLMCSFDFEKGVTTILSKVVSQIKKLKLSDGSNPAENFIERLVFKPENNSQEILRTLDELTSIINGLGEVDEEYKKAFLETILRAKETLNFNLIKILEADFWNNLDIILLDPKAYTVENYSPLEELQDGSKHEFLYDLLKLANKEANDFKQTGSSLDNTAADGSKYLSDQLKKIWKNHQVSLNLCPQGSNLYFLFGTPQGRSMELTNQSDGEQWFLRFYTKLATAEKLNKQFVWLMDEPGQSLHATSQINLKNYFESLSDNHQIIYTTHQPMMVPWQKLERIFVVENDVLRGTLIHQRFWKDEETESPLREALGLFVGEELLTGKEHIIVEGPSDYVYLQGWLSFFQRNRSGKLWREEYNLLERSFVPVQGKDTIPLYLLYLTKKTKGKINSIAIPDSKAAEDEVKKRLDGIDPLNKRVVSVSSLLSDIKIKDIEDLFEAKEFLTEVKEFYSKNYPEISFPTDFTEVKKSSLANGVINYVESKINFGVNLDGEPRGLDKVGSALNFYKKLSSDKKLPYSKETVKRFETVLKEVSKLLMTESSKT